MCLEAKIDRQLLLHRLEALDAEIHQKQQSRALLAAMLGEGALKSWHKDLDKLAPDAHLDWLIKQGFNEKQALQLKWLSKDMNEHDLYMADFMKVFDGLEYWGPGSQQDTQRALALLPEAPSNILEVGCGKGLATEVLATQTQAQITAIDNEQSALDRLKQRFENTEYSNRLHTVCASMTDLPFEQGKFDLIWAEGSAYIMDVEKAVKQWKPLLKQNGYLVFSDMVWKTETPSEEASALWDQEYPDIQTVQSRLKQMEKSGYTVIEHFPQSEQAWQNYYAPLGKRVTELGQDMANSAALADIKREVEICTQYANEFGYHMFILQTART